MTASGGRAIHVRGDVSNENEIQELFQQSAEQLGPVTGLVNNGRAGELEDVATATLWLLSEEAKYVTGAIIDVSGGLVTP